MCPEPPPAQQQDGGHWQQQLPTEALTSPYRAAFEHVTFPLLTRGHLFQSEMSTSHAFSAHLREGFLSAPP